MAQSGSRWTRLPVPSIGSIDHRRAPPPSPCPPPPRTPHPSAGRRGTRPSAAGGSAARGRDRGRSRSSGSPSPAARPAAPGQRDLGCLARQLLHEPQVGGQSILLHRGAPHSVTGGSPRIAPRRAFPGYASTGVPARRIGRFEGAPAEVICETPMAARRHSRGLRPPSPGGEGKAVHIHLSSRIEKESQPT